MRILVTGGAGYLGTQLVQNLSCLKETSEIVVFDNLSRGNFNLFIGDQKLGCPVQLVEADILDSRRFQQALQNIDVVFHLAAKVTTPFSDQNAHLFEQVNHWGTAETVYAIEKSQISKFVFLSSTSVYGTPDGEANESTSPRPKTNYGRSKLNAEKHVARLLRSDVCTYIIRCGNIFGYNPSMRFDSVINKFVFEVNFKNRICIHGDGEQCRSFIPVDRAADILSKLSQIDLPHGIYNLVENTLSVNQIADTLNEITPAMERVFIDQDLQLSQLRVEPNLLINNLTQIPPRPLQKSLEQFLSRFTF